MACMRGREHGRHDDTGWPENPSSPFDGRTPLAILDLSILEQRAHACSAR